MVYLLGLIPIGESTLSFGLRLKKFASDFYVQKNKCDARFFDIGKGKWQWEVLKRQFVMDENNDAIIIIIV